MSSIVRGGTNVWRRTRPLAVLILATGLSVATLSGLAGAIGR